MTLYHPSLGAVAIPDLIRSTALQYGLDPNLLMAVAQRESSLNPTAVSPAGAQGLFQLMPSTAVMLGVTNPFDPIQSANAGARYLSQLENRYGDLGLALMAYNWGPGNVDSWLETGAGMHGQPVPVETRSYVASILASAGSAGTITPGGGGTTAIYPQEAFGDGTAPQESGVVTILGPVTSGTGLALLLGAALLLGIWAYSR